MQLSDWIASGAVAVSSIGLGLTFLRSARVQGADLQRIRTLEDRTTALEADMRDAEHALAKVAVIETKVDSLDRLVTGQLDEIKYTLRGMETRSWAAAAAAVGSPTPRVKRVVPP